MVVAIIEYVFTSRKRKVIVPNQEQMAPVISTVRNFLLDLHQNISIERISTNILKITFNTNNSYTEGAVEVLENSFGLFIMHNGEKYDLNPHVRQIIGVKRTREYKRFYENKLPKYNNNPYFDY